MEASEAIEAGEAPCYAFILIQERIPANKEIALPPSVKAMVRRPHGCLKQSRWSEVAFFQS